MTERFADAVALPLRFIGAVLLILVTATAALAIEDTPENRAKQIDRYFETVPLEELTRDMMIRMAKQTPAVHQALLSEAFPKMTPEQRATAIELAKDASKLAEVTVKHLDFSAIKKIQRDALLKTLTADEIAALADFYASPAGKSAGAKMGKFSEELTPAMMPLVINAVIRAKSEEEKQ